MKNLYFQWHITDACNFRCRHCYQDNFTDSSGLDIGGLKRVSERIAQAAEESSSRAVVSITGGEPFLKKELFELLGYLDGFGQVGRLILISNASLINHETIMKLAAIKKLGEVKVSLEGASSPANDAIRGKGAFDKATRAIRSMKKAGLSVSVMFTAMKSNSGEVAGLFSLCRELGVDGLITERFFPAGTGAGLKGQLLNSGDWFNLVNTLLETAGASCMQQDVLAQRAFWVRFEDGEIDLLGAGCNVSKEAFCIMPNADVLPCRRFSLKIGNILKSPLSEIAGSSLLQDITGSCRKGKCSRCDVAGCRGCPALAYLLTGDYLSEDSQCWHEPQASKIC